ncbi:type II secretion system F family protein [Prosthecobacter sp.]|uniref:type II secretion system F family protein n=1 Tax=Prosthecobacter sp. TaxID=1965333 RepID=UPI00248A3CD6|nr:type II secretion system F family protein [Prosthecobacter sp.]MDI1314385.1 type II secretion system F family protein [Prosthecobacter sp.]
MPAFQYQALAADGSVKTGSLEAADRGDAVRLLARRGLQARSVQTMTAENKTAAAKPAAEEHLRVSKADVIRFTEDMGDLLASGLQVEQALHAMENRTSSGLGVLARKIRALVRDGVPLSAALRQTSTSFDELYCNMIAAGENSGSLPDIMDRQARHLRLMETLHGKVVGALIYPAFLIVSGAALAVVMVTYLLPKLAGLLGGTGKKLPFMIQASLWLSDFLKHWWWALLIFLGMLVMTLFAVRKTTAIRSGWHKLMLSLPAIRDITRAHFELLYFETLGSLLRGGVPLLFALELVRKAVTNLHLRQGLTKAEDMVREGSSLSNAMRKTDVLGSQSVDVIRIGEDTGHLAEVLGKAATRMDVQLTRTIERVTALIQPCLLLLMAVLVGGLVWTMVNIVFSTLSQLNR